MNIRCSASSFCHSNKRETAIGFWKLQDRMKQVDWWNSKRNHNLESSVVVAEMLETDLPNRTPWHVSGLRVSSWVRGWKQEVSWKERTHEHLIWTTTLNPILPITTQRVSHQHLPPCKTKQNLKILNKIFKPSLSPLFGGPCSLTADFLPTLPELWIQMLCSRNLCLKIDTSSGNPHQLHSLPALYVQTVWLTRQMRGSTAGSGTIADDATPRAEH